MMIDLELERKAFEEDLAEHLTERNSDEEAEGG